MKNMDKVKRLVKLYSKMTGETIDRQEPRKGIRTDDISRKIKG